MESAAQHEGGGDIIEAVQPAVVFTGQPTSPVESGPALLTNNGPGFLAKALEEFLKLRAMKHITASPFHPQTNGMLDRYHRTAKASVDLFIYHSPEALSDAMDTFVDYYNYRRYHEALGNATPGDFYFGRREAILARREDVERQSLTQRRSTNLSTA